MNIRLPTELRNKTAVYSHVLELFEYLIKGRNITMTHTVESLTLTGSERSFTFDLYNGGPHATFPIDPCKYRGKLSVMPGMPMTEYVGWCGEIIQKAVDYVDPESALLFKSEHHEESNITEDDVNKYTIDWNKWHDTVKESLDAFEFDNAADTCKKLGLTLFPETDEDDFSVKAGFLRQDIESIIERLIALHELDWDGKTICEDGYKIFEKCHAYRDTDGELYAGLKLRQTLSDNLFDPRIEIRLVKCETDIPWFNINLIAVGQFF